MPPRFTVLYSEPTCAAEGEDPAPSWFVMDAEADDAVEVFDHAEDAHAHAARLNDPSGPRFDVFARRPVHGYRHQDGGQCYDHWIVGEDLPKLEAERRIGIAKRDRWTEAWMIRC